MWNEDIQEYSETRERDSNKVSKILVSKGWNPDKYDSSMKDALFEWLDQWYTLSIKKLPTPATSRRRNPVSPYRRYTRLGNGWQILTTNKEGGFVTIARNGSGQDRDELVIRNNSQGEADQAHLSLIQEVMDD